PPSPHGRGRRGARTLRLPAGGRATALGFSPDGAVLATACLDSVIRVWDADTGRPRRSLAGHDRPALSVVFGPDGRTVASGGSDRVVRVWDGHTGRQLHRLG